MTEIFVWNSYSCNNSSDYRLIAEFGTPARAAAMAKELASFFKAHAKEHDKQSDAPDFDWPGEPTETARAFGKKYGHRWSKFLMWGDEMLEGDEPNVAALGKNLVLYHTYSSGGFGPDIPAVLKKAGATLPEKGAKDGAPVLYGELGLPPGPKGGRLASMLETFFAQRLAGQSPHEWTSLEGLELQHRGDPEDYTFWSDGTRVAFTWPLDPEALPEVTRYLEKRGAKGLSLRLAEKRDRAANDRRAEELARAHDAAVEKAQPKERPAGTAKAKARATKGAAAEGTFDPRGLSFLFTGKLASMQRAEAQKRAARLGGKVAGSVSKDLDVLVIGDDGSPLFGGGAKGEKQRKAEQLVAGGARIRIISETAFLQLGTTAAASAATPSAPAATPSAPPTALPRLVRTLAPIDEFMPVYCGSTIADGTLYLVGGRGENFMMKSTDGKKFVEIKSDGPGLRAIVLAGKEMWVAGEYGHVGHSTNGGRKFTALSTKTRGCLHALARTPDGTLWVGGDGGYLARLAGKAFKRVSGIRGTLNRLQVLSLGLVASTDAGLFLIASSTPKKLGISTPVYQALVTSRGTLLVVGAKNTIYRSVDSGTSFARAKVPAFKPVRIPKAKQMVKAYWETPRQSLLALDELPDGRVVVGGEQGVLLVSSDDGKTFRALRQTFTDGQFGIVRAFGGGLVIGGDHRIIVRAS